LHQGVNQEQIDFIGSALHSVTTTATETRQARLLPFGPALQK
jgi:hypothetical protein